MGYTTNILRIGVHYKVLGGDSRESNGKVSFWRADGANTQRHESRRKEKIHFCSVVAVDVHHIGIKGKEEEVTTDFL